MRREDEDLRTRLWMLGAFIVGVPLTGLVLEANAPAIGRYLAVHHPTPDRIERQVDAELESHARRACLERAPGAPWSSSIVVRHRPGVYGVALEGPAGAATCIVRWDVSADRWEVVAYQEG